MASLPVRLLLLALAAALGLPPRAPAATLPDGDAPGDRLVLQGSLAEMQGDLRAAAGFYRRALETDQAPRVAAEALCRLSLQADDEEGLDAAARWLARRDPAAPELPVWLNRLYIRDRAAELDRELAALPDTLFAHLRIQRLMEFGTRADSAAAATALERAFAALLRLEPARWEARRLSPPLFWEQVMGYAMRFGRAAEAGAWIDSSRLAAADPAAWLVRTRLAALREDLPALRRSLERGRALDSLEAFYPLMAGRLALEDGETEEALRELRLARRLDPEDPGIISVLAVALEEGGRLDEAESLLRVLLTLEPGDEDLWMRLAGLLQRQDRQDEALAVYARGLSRLGEGAGPLYRNNYAYTLAQAGEGLEEATAMAREAVAAVPDNAAFRDTLGWLFYLAGDFAAADEELTRAYDLSLGRPDPEILEHLGHLRARQGRREEAAALWRRALELAPGKDRLRVLLDGLSEHGSGGGPEPGR